MGECVCLGFPLPRAVEPLGNGIFSLPLSPFSYRTNGEKEDVKRTYTPERERERERKKRYFHDGSIARSRRIWGDHQGKKAIKAEYTVWGGV